MCGDIFEHHRARLTGIAYGMLGSIMDAEDVVQDTYLRWSRVDGAAVESPAAYLTTVTTRLAIDRLRSAARRRETYPGPWLPEPLVSDVDEDPAAIVAEAERLSMALLATMERLNPLERAVFLLRDVFDLDYAEVADIVDKSPVNCRQIASRARRHVGGGPVPSPTPQPDELRLVTAYADAIVNGDVPGLAELLAEDVVLWSDGGGKARAALHPLAGRDRVAKYLVGVARWAPQDIDVRLMRVNGGLGWYVSAAEVPLAVVAFEISDGRIIGLRIVLNPDKIELRP